jgi:hypothetical protein
VKLRDFFLSSPKPATSDLLFLHQSKSHASQLSPNIPGPAHFPFFFFLVGLLLLLSSPFNYTLIALFFILTLYFSHTSSNYSLTLPLSLASSSPSFIHFPLFSFTSSNSLSSLSTVIHNIQLSHNYWMTIGVLL